MQFEPGSPPERRVLREKEDCYGSDAYGQADPCGALLTHKERPRESGHRQPSEHGCDRQYQAAIRCLALIVGAPNMDEDAAYDEKKRPGCREHLVRIHLDEGSDAKVSEERGAVSPSEGVHRRCPKGQDNCGVHVRWA